MQFVDAKADIAFKKIFGDEHHKGILIGFLNAVLDLHGDRCIRDVTSKNPWQPPDIPILKETILDIKAVDCRGITFLVEMQVKDHPGFDKRTLYYTAKTYTGQIKRGDDYPKLNQVIFIGILDFDCFEGDNYLTRHLILNRETLRQELADFEFNFIELRKFDKKEEELHTVIEKWVYFIKNVGNLAMVPKSAEEIPELREAYAQAAVNAWSENEFEIYEYWQIRDAADRYKLAEERDKAKIEGLMDGKSEGLLEGKMEVARKLKQKGLPVAEIMELTGLGREEVEAS